MSAARGKASATLTVALAAIAAEFLRSENFRADILGRAASGFHLLALRVNQPREAEVS